MIGLHRVSGTGAIALGTGIGKNKRALRIFSTKKSICNIFFDALFIYVGKHFFY